MNANQLPDQFLQPGNLATLSGAAFLVWIVMNGLRYFAGYSPKWMPLFISAIVILILQGLSSATFSALLSLLLVGNTFLLAFTAVGLNETMARGGERPTGQQQSEGGTYPWFSSWFG